MSDLDKYIQPIAKTTESILLKMNINNNVSLNMNKCLKIIGDITKEIYNIVELKNKISSMDTKEKLNTINTIIIKVLKTDIIKKIVSEEQINEVLNLCKNEETMNVILDMVSWVADVFLNKLDTNNDGVVTKDEATNCYINCCLGISKKNPDGCSCYGTDGCCSCCTPCVKSTSKCWTSCLFTICCANDEEINIDSPKE